MSPVEHIRVGVIGGGAAGYFAAITCAEARPGAEVIILEATHDPLDKVRISGGGRCNVTHHCFDPKVLVQGYPRGGRELLGPFNRFQPADTVAWFEKRGVRLKAEDDGRMFPTTDNSSTIVECLQHAARDAGVSVRLGWRAVGISRKDDSFEVGSNTGEKGRFDRVLIASGNARVGHELAASLGHTIMPCVPSLFTFKVKDARLEGLSGVSVPDVEARLKVGEAPELIQQGPMLITHWGLSGPAILKLSSWGARPLFENRYRADLIVNLLPEYNERSLMEAFHKRKDAHAKKKVVSDNFLSVPKRLWQRLAESAGINAEMTWAHMDRESGQRFALQLVAGEYEVTGKGIFKEEFVTCGGVSLKEVDFRTMQSRRCPGLYFAGEILDIDGITGGYNFQSAWTTGWIAGKSMM